MGPSEPLVARLYTDLGLQSSAACQPARAAHRPAWSSGP